MIVVQLQAELTVDLDLAHRNGLTQNLQQPARFIDQLLDLGAGKAPRLSWGAVTLAFEGRDDDRPLGLDLGNPARDDNPGRPRLPSLRGGGRASGRRRRPPDTGGNGSATGRSPD